MPLTAVTLAMGWLILFGNDGNAGPVRLRIELRLTGEGRLEAVKP